MMQAQQGWIKKLFTVAMACGALTLAASPQAFSQGPKNTLQEDVSKQESLMKDGSQKVNEGARKLQQAMKVLEERKDYSKARQTIAQANQLMQEGEKQLTKAQKMDKKLLHTIKSNRTAHRKMMEGSWMMRNGISKMMKDERDLSSAKRLIAGGQSVVQQGEKMVNANQGQVASAK